MRLQTFAYIGILTVVEKPQKVEIFKVVKIQNQICQPIALKKVERDILNEYSRFLNITRENRARKMTNYDVIKTLNHYIFL